MNLKSKTDFWVLNKFISKEQQQLILKHEDKRFFPFILMSFCWFGIFCFLIGVFSLIHKYWGVIPESVKWICFIFFIIFILFSSFYFIKTNKKRIVEFFLWISFFMIGGSVGLAAQLFNLPITHYDGIFIWAILSLFTVFISKKEFLFLLWIPLFLGGLLGYIKLELLLLFFEQSPVFFTSLLSGFCLLIIYVTKFFKSQLMSAVYKWSLFLYFLILFLGDKNIKNALFGTVLSVFFLLLLLAFSVKERRVILFNIVSLFIVLRLILLCVQLFPDTYLIGMSFLSIGFIISFVGFIWFLTEKRIKNHL